jgi:hypothetical protein
MSHRTIGHILVTTRQPEVQTLRSYVSPGPSPVVVVPHVEPLRCSIANRVRQLPDRERKLMLRLLTDWQRLIR